MFIKYKFTLLFCKDINQTANLEGYQFHFQSVCRRQFFCEWLRHSHIDKSVQASINKDWKACNNGAGTPYSFNALYNSGSQPQGVATYI